MKTMTTLSLAMCFAFCLAADGQDTRITPGMPAKLNGIKSSQPGGQENEGAACDGSATCDGEDCPVIAKAMEALPKMVFRVGDEETCCHMTATRLAHESHEKITYVVGKKKFYESRDAFESLVKQTEMYVKKYVTPKVCDESGVTTVAGESCECSTMASKLTNSVNAATKDIKITYRVGEKTFDKFHDARRYAKKSHKKGMFIVGDEKYKDELEARLALAHKKYRSAVTAIHTLKTQSKTTDADSSVDTEVASKDG